MQQGISHIDNSERNRKVILNIIRETGSINRQEISVVSDLSISTTKRLIEQLLTDGIVIEKKNNDQHSHRGRKAKSLCLNDKYGFSIGISVDPNRIKISTLNFAGTPLNERKVNIDNLGKDFLIGEIVRLAKEEIKTHDDEGILFGVGVGIPGLVDARRGLVHYCPNLEGWEQVELTGLLKEELKQDVFVDDSVRLMALSEKRYGVAKGIKNYLYVYIGDGVGLGIVLDNRFFRGENGISGEFGHMTIKQDGPLCNCGNHGCLEALVSIEAILHSIRNSLDNNIYSSLKAFPRDEIDIEKISSASLNGDKLAAMIIHDVAKNIGIGAADLMNVFDPGVIIFNGEVVEKLNGILDDITKTVRLRGIAAISQRTKFFIGKSNPWAGSRGAATAMIEKFLNCDILNL